MIGNRLRVKQQRFFSATLFIASLFVIFFFFSSNTAGEEGHTKPINSHTEADSFDELAWNSKSGILSSEEPRLIDGLSEYLLRNVTLHPSIDKDIDASNAGSLPVLTNFKNPCWYELVDTSYDYTNNSIVLAYDGLNKHGYHHNSLRVMSGILRGRDVNRDGITWRLRCLPYFYVAGISKCGTTDLAITMASHPKVISSHRKEWNYWNRIRYTDKTDLRCTAHLGKVPVPRPLRDFVDVYDVVAERIRDRSMQEAEGHYNDYVTADFTPSYAHDFDGWHSMEANQHRSEPGKIIADIIYQLTPTAKIIFILRNPTSRLYSNYLFFNTGVNVTHEGFLKQVRRSISLSDECFRTLSPRECIYDRVAKYKTFQNSIGTWGGIYYLYLRDWLQVFPRKQVFITRLEDYAVNKTHVANQIAHFLDIGSFPSENVTSNESVMNARRAAGSKLGDIKTEAKAIIDEYYRPWNKKLAELLDEDKFLWHN